MARAPNPAKYFLVPYVVYEEGQFVSTNKAVIIKASSLTEVGDALDMETHEGSFPPELVVAMETDTFGGSSVERVGDGFYYVAGTPETEEEFEEGEIPTFYVRYGDASVFTSREAAEESALQDRIYSPLFYTVDRGGLREQKSRKNPRRRNQGRQYEDWVQFELDGIADQEDVEITPELREEAAKFESAVYAALDEWTRKHPPRDGSSVDELFEEGNAPWNVYATLVGHGVGIWDGRWDQYYSEKEIEQLRKFLEKRLGKFADVTGGGSLGEAFHEAAHAAENPRRSRRRRR